MDLVFHEKQEGNLCAQHCLNALLQDKYFTAVDLASIARELDDLERESLSDSHVGVAATGHESHNYDDSGYFSVQVIEKALELWGLSLVMAGSSKAPDVLARPWEEKAFICHFNNHWFTIRKLGKQWFNLNSMQKGPKFISDTYLALFLAQLAAEGYFIFAVRGQLPESEADQMLTLCPYDPSVEKERAKTNDTHKWGKPAGSTIAGQISATSQSPSKVANPESVRNKRLQYFNTTTSDQSRSTSSHEELSFDHTSSNFVQFQSENGDDSFELQLEQAIKLSLMPID